LDARTLAVWLLSVGVHPDRAVVSPADRTRQTWAAMLDVTAWGVAAEFDDCVYAGDSQTITDELRVSDPEVQTVLVVGHNPSVAYLAQILADGEGQPVAELAMAAGFPTCSAALFEVSVPWADLEPGVARLTDFHVGRSQ
jgi:phosphohistidine phosphatase